MKKLRILLYFPNSLDGEFRELKRDLINDRDHNRREEIEHISYAYDETGCLEEIKDKNINVVVLDPLERINNKIDSEAIELIKIIRINHPGEIAIVLHTYAELAKSELEINYNDIPFYKYITIDKTYLRKGESDKYFNDIENAILRAYNYIKPDPNPNETNKKNSKTETFLIFVLAGIILSILTYLISDGLIEQETISDIAKILLATFTSIIGFLIAGTSRITGTFPEHEDIQVKIGGAIIFFITTILILFYLPYL